MRIFEEYFVRNKITDVPLVHHCKFGSLILKSTDVKSQSRFMLVNIKWQDHDHHPGQYIFEISFPVHDGYLNDISFSNFNLPVIKKKWDEYENFILDWIQSLNNEFTPVIENEKEVSLAAWEMFVFVYDSWFLKQSFDVKRLLFESLDKEKSIEYRFKHFQEIMTYLTNHYPNLMRTWRYEILSRLQNYSHWLAKLINDHQYKK